MDSKSKKLIIVVCVIILILIIFIATRKKEEGIKSIVDNSLETTVLTRDERKDAAINNAISQLEKQGLTITDKVEISADEAIGYSYKINGENMQIYYLEKNKLAQIVIGGSTNGEVEIILNGVTKKALSYNNLIILNCTNNETKAIIENTLGRSR